MAVPGHLSAHLEASRKEDLQQRCRIVVSCSQRVLAIRQSTNCRAQLTNAYFRPAVDALDRGCVELEEVVKPVFRDVGSARHIGDESTTLDDADTKFRPLFNMTSSGSLPMVSTFLPNLMSLRVVAEHCERVL
eukprot:TRINITY_DN13958_c0_g2_i1.p2 TRINITY_DN13958_c0_g2~~TRINITY_DN13958_c0_g2_i1.p2  ORF type:complete len:133 (-),score=15.38 TRINITY_DN13958_c0_g2_i1:96-494(-)